MRESGILMPVSSLPGPYGIGCFGTEAETFVDFLAAAGQKIWQILPLSPTGYGTVPIRAARPLRATRTSSTSTPSRRRAC